MADHKTTVRFFVMTSSEPIRRKLLRMFDELPVVALVGVAREKFFAPQRLAGLKLDLLLLNVCTQQHGATKPVDYVSEHLPYCKTIVFSKPAATESVLGLLEAHGANTVRGTVTNVGTAPIDSMKIRTEIKKSIEQKSRQVAAAGAAGHPFDYVEYLSSEPDEKSFHGVMRDITERRRKQGGRRHSEINKTASAAKFRAFVEQLPGMPYIASPDNEGSHIYISPRIEELLGFTAGQWCNDPTLRVAQLHPEDRRRVLAATQAAVETNGTYSLDYRIYASDGTIHWFHDEARVMTDDAGNPLFLQGAILDITDRKRAQEELEKSHGELQELITALDSLRTEEQKRLAHEMHDDLGQLLSAMKLDLCTLQKHLPQPDSEVIKYLSSINELVDTMVTSVRRIIADLPPQIVEDLGLFNALISMGRSFEKRHRICCNMEMPDITHTFETRVATAIYRMVQEALNNVAKHASATSVTLKVDCSETAATISIADNGAGISPGSQQKAGSFGLKGMRERAIAMGGSVTIESWPGEGTAIKIFVPIAPSGTPDP